MSEYSVLVIKKLNDYDDPTVNKLLIHNQIRLEALDIELIIPDKNPVLYPEVLTAIRKRHSIDLVVSIGGDGTAICAARIASEIGRPLFAYNNGHLGFLADRDIRTLSADVVRSYERSFGDQEIKRDDDDVFTKRNTLQLYVDKNLKDKSLPSAINEYVVSSPYSDTIIELDMYIDNRYAGKHIGNGVLISTPTGSTAYALSLGGPLIDPNSHVVQISFIAPFTLTARPMIVSSYSEIRFEIITTRYNNPIVVKCDGQEITKALNTIVIKRGDVLLMGHVNNWSFYDVLSNKINWNKK